HDTDSEGSGGEVDVVAGGALSTTVTIHVGNTGSYRSGQSVVVLVNPENHHVTLPGENYKPDGFDAGFGVLGIVCGVTLIAAGVWFARASAKRRRSKASAWRTVDAHFVRTHGDNGATTILYMPEFSTDQLWSVKAPFRDAKTRVQIAGQRDGLV